MDENRWERWGAASGYVVLALGIAAAAFERGAPPAGAPVEETVAFLTTYRTELLAQSLLFVLSAGAYLWFFGSLRAFLRRGEGQAGTLSDIAYAAGAVWTGLQMVFQSVQVTLAMATGRSMEPAIAAMFSNLAYALSVVAYVPLAAMLGAVAAVSLRSRVLPAWIGWLSLVMAAAHLAMSAGIVVDTGPLVPGGALTYLLYLSMPIWLVAVTTAMVVRPRKPRSVASPQRV